MLARPAVPTPAAVGRGFRFRGFIDRDGGLTAHLVVEVAQIGGLLPVIEQAIEGQCAGVGGAQPAPDQDDCDQSALGVGPLVEVGRCFDLGHDVLGNVTGESGRASGQVAGEEHRGGRQARVPVVLADRLEEDSGRGDGILLRAAADGLGGKPCQVAFEQGAVNIAERVGLWSGLGQECAEPRETEQIILHGAQAQSRTQS